MSSSSQEYEWDEEDEGEDIAKHFMQACRVREDNGQKDPSERRKKTSGSGPLRGYRRQPGKGHPDDISAKCPYFKKCEEYMESMDLGDSCWSTDHMHLCFCKICHKDRGDGDYYLRGNPPAKYAIPIGWARFTLAVPRHKLDKLNVGLAWHVAFHGTTPEAVPKIIDNGQLLMAGDVALGGKKLSTGEGHYNEKFKPDGFNINQMFVSPTIKYAGMDVYAKPHGFRDYDGNLYRAKVAFHCWIRPGSYTTGRETVKPSKTSPPIDEGFRDSELEWSTEERGAIVPYGLLINLEKM